MLDFFGSINGFLVGRLQQCYLNCDFWKANSIPYPEYCQIYPVQHFLRACTLLNSAPQLLDAFLVILDG